MSFPTKSTLNAARHSSPGWNSRSSAPTKQTATTILGQAEATPKYARVRRRVGDHEVGGLERISGRALSAAHAPNRRPHRTSRRSRDHRVLERDERVEDDGPASGDSPSGPQVDVARVADDEDVRVLRRAPGEARAARAPDGRASEALGDSLWRSPSQTGTWLSSTWTPAPREGRRSPARCAGSRARTYRSRGRARGACYRRTPSTSWSIRSRSSRRSSCWDVTSSERRPSDTNWMPTTIINTPSVSSGRCPIASPQSQATVR